MHKTSHVAAITDREMTLESTLTLEKISWGFKVSLGDTVESVEKCLEGKEETGKGLAWKRRRRRLFGACMIKKEPFA